MTNLTHRPSPTPVYPPGWLVGQLPVGMRDDDLLVRFTTIFERLGATLRAGADGIEHAVDPTVTTPGMLRYLGAWLGYDLLDPDLEVLRQRAIIEALGRALPLRGTRRGLQVLLEAVTDAPVVIEDPGAVLRDGESHTNAGEVVVRVRNAGHLREHEFAALLRDEIPAHLGLRLVIAAPGDDADAGDGPERGPGGDHGGDHGGDPGPPMPPPPPPPAGAEPPAHPAAVSPPPPPSTDQPDGDVPQVLDISDHSGETPPVSAQDEAAPLQDPEDTP